MSDEGRPPESNGWMEWRRYVLGKLDDLHKDIGAVGSNVDNLRDKDIRQMQVDIALLKLKAGAFGGIAGAVIAAGITLLVKLASGG